MRIDSRLVFSGCVYHLTLGWLEEGWRYGEMVRCRDGGASGMARWRDERMVRGGVVGWQDGGMTRWRDGGVTE